MGDHLVTLMIAAAVNIFVILLLFVAAKALKKYADRLFHRQEQVLVTLAKILDWCQDDIVPLTDGK